MPDQLQLRGGTTTEHNSFTGVTREVTVDTTKKTLVVHDGSTAGGTPLMKESGTLDPTSILIGTGGTQRLKISNTEVVLNETGANTDFRIEGDTDANLFKVDASIDKIGIGAVPLTTGAKLEVSRSVTGGFADASDTILRLLNTNNSADTNQTSLEFTTVTTGSGADSAIVSQAENASGNSRLEFWTDTNNGMTEKMVITSAGKIGINDATPDADLSVSNSNSSQNAAFVDIGKAGGNRFKVGYEGNNCFLGATASTGMFIFKQNVNSDGNPQASGSEVFRINDKGNASLGSSVISDDSEHCKFVISGQSQNAAGILVFQDTSNNEDGMIFADNANLYIVADRDNTTPSSNIIFRVDGSNEKCRITSDGDLTFSRSASSNYPTQKIKWSNDSTTTNGFYISQHSDRNGRIWHEQGLSLVFGTSNQERMTIVPDGHVGIGTTTPDLLGSTTDSTYLAVIETSGTRRGKLLLGDNQNADTGGIGDIHFVGHYQHSGHKEMATIKAVARGGTSGQRGADLVFETKADGTSTMNECLRIGTDKRITQKGGDLIIDNTNNGYGGLRIVDDTSGDYNVNFIAGRNQGATAFVFKRNGRNQGTIPWANSGSEATHVRIASGGIAFGGDSAVANTLDDYEEGTWTPIFTDDGTSGNSASSYTHQLGWYTKIGNIVNLQLRVSGSNTTGMNSSHNAYIKGLPFPIKGSSNRLVTGVALLSNINLDSTTMSIGVLANVGAGSGSDNSFFRIFQVNDNSGWEPIKVSQFPSGNHEMLINLTYRAA